VNRHPLATHLLGAARREWRVLMAVLPGLVLTMLHSTILDLPKADVVAALDSDRYRIQWITGAYILGSAVGMGMTGFVGSRLGLRRAYLLALFLFTAAGSACAGVSDVLWMAPLRLVQGYGTGLLISAGMVLLWRAFPVHKEFAMALYGMGVYLSALAGAPLGGLLTAGYSWQLLFLVNLPLGLLVGLVAWLTLPPDRLASGERLRFDWLGLGLLASLVVTLSVVLDMGQYWGWLTSPFFVPWVAGLVVSLAAFTAWGLCAAAPLVNLRPLAVGHFALGLGIKVAFSVNLYVLVALLSSYMIGLRGYQWWQGSLVLLPALGGMFVALLAGTFWGTDGNRKARMFLGLGVMALSTWLLSVLDLYTAKGWQAVHLTLWGMGAGLVAGPALLTTFEGLTTEQTLRTAGVFNILRSLPVFVAGGILGTLLTRHTDAQFDVLRQNIRYNRPVVSESLRGPEGHFLGHGSPRAQARPQAHAALGRWVHANARAFALQDILRLLMLVPAAALVLVLLVRVPATHPNGDALGRWGPGPR
jgi:EmrB/QacA subfamily drug resistance transporter